MQTFAEVGVVAGIAVSAIVAGGLVLRGGFFLRGAGWSRVLLVAVTVLSISTAGLYYGLGAVCVVLAVVGCIAAFSRQSAQFLLERHVALTQKDEI